MNSRSRSIFLLFAVLAVFLTGTYRYGVGVGMLGAWMVAATAIPVSPLLGANTITNLIPDAYKALDVVSREQIGFIPAVARDAAADAVAVGQTLRSIVAPANTSAADITPAMSLPSAGDQTIGNVAIQITKSRWAKFSWSGPERNAIDRGPGFLTTQQDQIAQALRALANEVEIDLGTAFAAGASRAYGTAGTTPFATAAEMSDFSQSAKILDDNGAPASDRHMVLNTTAVANIRGKQSQLFKANEAGTDSMLRNGELGQVMNFGMHQSAGVNNATAGTGASYLINNGAGYAIGATALTLDTGSGTILAGDIITIGSHKYVVATALAANVVTIAEPGLRAAVADNAAVTVNATSARNAAFSRNALLLATRLPDIGPDGDQATDRGVIIDPYTMLAFEIARYPGFRMNVYFVGISWGVKMLKPEHGAVLLG